MAQREQREQYGYEGPGRDRPYGRNRDYNQDFERDRDEDRESDYDDGRRRYESYGGRDRQTEYMRGYGGDHARGSDWGGDDYGRERGEDSSYGFEGRDQQRRSRGMGGMMGQQQGGTGTEGRYRGMGPKGYARGDDRIREDVCNRLTDDAHLDASEIEVELKDGEVTLTGTVRERQDKRHAEDIVDAASGVKHVQNNLRVKPAAAGSEEDGGDKQTPAMQGRGARK